MFIYLFEEAVVGLFGGAYFYRLHHFAGGDDDAADEFEWWGAGHGGCVCVCVVFGIKRSDCLERGPGVRRPRWGNRIGLLMGKSLDTLRSTCFSLISVGLPCCQDYLKVKYTLVNIQGSYVSISARSPPKKLYAERESGIC